MIHLLPEPAALGELRFVHAHRVWLILGLLASAGAVAAVTLIDDVLPRLVFTAGPALAAFRFLRSSLRRYELVVDPTARRWRRKSGLYFAPRSASGSLDDLTGVVLTLRHVRTGSGSSERSVPMWSVSLEFEGSDWDGTPLLVGLVEGDEAGAYQMLEDYARKLRADAVDRTSQRESRRAWDALNAAVEPVSGGGAYGEAAAEGVSADRVATAPPPPGSAIETTMEGGRRRITLPPHGASVGTLLGGAFGLVFGLVGVLFVIEALGLGPFLDGAAAEGGMSPVAVVVGAVFVWFAIGSVRAAVGRAGSREWVLDLPDSLRFGTTRSGEVREWTELPKESIEEVVLRTPSEGGSRLHVLGFRVRTGPRDPAEAALVRIRTDDALVRIGQRLTPEAKAWLREAIAAAAGTGAKRATEPGT